MTFLLILLGLGLTTLVAQINRKLETGPRIFLAVFMFLGHCGALLVGGVKATVFYWAIVGIGVAFSYT